MDGILDFWNAIIANWGEEEVLTAADEFGFDTTLMTPYLRIDEDDLSELYVEILDFIGFGLAKINREKARLFLREAILNPDGSYLSDEELDQMLCE